MLRRHANESTDPLVGCLGVEVGRTAVAARISRFAVKSSCSCEWGAWDQLSDDGPGHYNPDRSEGPWGKALGSLNGGALAHRVPRLRSRIRRYRQRSARKAVANYLSRSTWRLVGRPRLIYRP